MKKDRRAALEHFWVHLRAAQLAKKWGKSEEGAGIDAQAEWNRNYGTSSDGGLDIEQDDLYPWQRDDA